MDYAAMVTFLKLIGLLQGGDNKFEMTFYSEESRLFANLMRHYNKYTRPVVTPNQTVSVKFDVIFQDIIDFDVQKQELHTVAWLHETWTDMQLKWNASEHGDVETINLPSNAIWRPDILLYNSRSDKWGPMEETLALVNGTTGQVLWVPPIHLRSSCIADLSKFPYDKHRCKLMFGSWTYSTAKVDMIPNMKFTKDITTTHEWKMELVDVNRMDTKYLCCPEPYVTLTYTLELTRQAGNYVNKLIAPSIILALVIPVVFLLPTGSKSKITLGSSVLLALLLMALLMEHMIPSRGRCMPYIAIFNLNCVILTALSLISSAFINTAWSRSGNVPGILQKVFLKVLGKAVCVTDESVSTRKEEENPGSDAHASATVSDQWRRLALVLDRLLLAIFILAIFILVIVVYAQ